MRYTLFPILFLFISSILIDWVIWSDIRHYAKRNLWSKLYAISAVVCWIFIAVVMSLPVRNSDSGILAIMWMIYGYISLYIPKLIYVICSLLGRLPKIWKARRVNTGLWVGVPLGIVTMIAMIWGAFFTRRDIDVNEVEIYSTKLPDSFDGYRIVQFSDAHVGTWGNDISFISTLVDSINAQNADLIVFTGDIVNRETSELEPFIKVLSRLNARDGVVSILGNHDYGDYVDWETPSLRTENNALLYAWQRQMGWRMLNNERMFLKKGNDSIPLIGVENWGEPPFHQYGNLTRAYPLSSDSVFHLNDNRFKILLSHNPEHWNREVSKISNIDLTLSGHTHAMQFMISLGNWRWSPAKYRYQQWGGLYERLNDNGEPTKIYVNIGCGEVGLPARFGAIPELTVFNLHKKK